jgi:hypothetical protein
MALQDGADLAWWCVDMMNCNNKDKDAIYF